MSGIDTLRCRRPLEQEQNVSWSSLRIVQGLGRKKKLFDIVHCRIDSALVSVFLSFPLFFASPRALLAGSVATAPFLRAEPVETIPRSSMAHCIMF